MKKIFVILIILIIFIVGTYIGFSFVAPNQVIDILGFKPYVVKSDSMKPVIKRGDLIIVKKTKTNSLKPNDIVAFKKDKNMLIAHYIADVDINKENQLVFRTKTSINKEKKDWDVGAVKRKQVIGKVTKTIPFIGYIVLFFKSIYGIITALAAIILIYVLRSKIEEEKG